LGFLPVFLSVNGFQHASHGFDLVVRHIAENIAVKMNHTPLPLSVGEKLTQEVNKSKAFVADRQLDTGETTLLQMTEEVSPAILVFLRASFMSYKILRKISYVIDADPSEISLRPLKSEQ
jgi:hypothetical protein